MLKRFPQLMACCLAGLILLAPAALHAQEDAPVPDQRLRGIVTSVDGEGTIELGGELSPVQKVRVQVQDGDDAGRELRLEHGSVFPLTDSRRVEQGMRVVLTKISSLDGSETFIISDQYRLPSVLLILLAFFVLVVAVSRLKGFTSLLGLGFSILVIATYIVPQIVKGASPEWTSLIGSMIIVAPTLYLAHGFRKRTTVALAGTLITVVIAVGLAWLFVHFASLFGMGSEEAYQLQFGRFASINLQGLLLGGIIIGALGVLDDVTATQAAAVDELARANPDLGWKQLYRRGMSVGREHITSMVNTLALAYAGASLPLFLMFAFQDSQPLWAIMNQEFISEEIVRTMVGSMSLILAVPITTLLASHFLCRGKKKSAEAG